MDMIYVLVADYPSQGVVLATSTSPTKIFGYLVTALTNAVADPPELDGELPISITLYRGTGIGPKRVRYNLRDAESYVRSTDEGAKDLERAIAEARDGYQNSYDLAQEEYDRENGYGDEDQNPNTRTTQPPNASF